MNKYVLPLASKMNQQIYLNAVKQTMNSLVPLLMVASFALIPQALEQWITIPTFLEQIFAVLAQLTIGMLSVYVVCGLAYYLANARQMNVSSCILLSLLAFLILTFKRDQTDTIIMANFGPQGIFLAILISILAIEFLRYCQRVSFFKKVPEIIPPFVLKSLENIPLMLLFLGFFLLLRILFYRLAPNELMNTFLSPLTKTLDTAWGYTCLKFIQCALFFFGIHPAVLDSILMPVMNQFLGENILAYQNNAALQHLFTKGMDSPFGNLTGTGVTFGLIFWCLFSKAQNPKRLGKMALIPSLFGVNETLIFGAPVVLNPIFFIPFVIIGPILSSFGAWAMQLGFLKKSVFTPPYVGVFLEGLLATFDGQALIINGLQLVLSIVCWYPFFKVYEKQELEKERLVDHA